MGGQPQRGEPLGGQDGEVPRSVHQVGRVPARDHPPPHPGAGGKGLDDFREAMLTDNRLRSIDDYLSAADVFPGVGLKGGVCYFLWERDNPGRFN
ncbi:MAG: Eco57I restriction-modification methylase domain-containing protein [Nitrosomonas sp.]|nr:Eco57I restriction-modification methylase domain-containing protein [Nitrosomonas sp.]